MFHLAIYSKKRNAEYIDMLLDGQVLTDIKWMYNKVAPYKRLNIDDVIFIKESSGPVVGKVEVAGFEYIDVFHPDQIRDIMLENFDDMAFKDEEQLNRYAAKKAHKRYGTLIRFKNPVRLKKPIRIEKLDRRVWIADYKLPIDLQLT